jgi:hypothetical protein
MDHPIHRRSAFGKLRRSKSPLRRIEALEADAAILIASPAEGICTDTGSGD